MPLEIEVSPKTDAAEFGRELFAARYCRDDFGFGRAAFCQPHFGMRMQGNFHISILLCAQMSFGSMKKRRFSLSQLAFNDLNNPLKLGFGFGGDFLNFFLER